MMNGPAKNVALEKSGNDLIGRRVFLVEDESLVTMLIEDTLADLGCEMAGLASKFADAAHKPSRCHLMLPFWMSI